LLPESNTTPSLPLLNAPCPSQGNFSHFHLNVQPPRFFLDGRIGFLKFLFLPPTGPPGSVFHQYSLGKTPFLSPPPLPFETSSSNRYNATSPPYIIQRKPQKLAYVVLGCVFSLLGLTPFFLYKSPVCHTFVHDTISSFNAPPQTLKIVGRPTLRPPTHRKNLRVLSRFEVSWWELSLPCSDIRCPNWDPPSFFLSPS